MPDRNGGGCCSALIPPETRDQKPAMGSLDVPPGAVSGPAESFIAAVLCRTAPPPCKRRTSPAS